MQNDEEMEEETREEFNTKLRNSPKEFLSELSDSMKTNKKERVKDLLSIMENKPSLSYEKIKNYLEGEDENDEKEGKKDGSESLLHVAVKYEDDLHIIQRIINLCPDLLSFANPSVNYKGQTPLHIAITKRHEKLTKLLLSCSKLNMNGKITNLLIKQQATGEIFKNTIMMGELPLSVAALSFDKNIVDLLLKHKAKIKSKNSSGDTVLHSLVKYAAVYPDKMDNVIDMFNYLHSKFKHKHFHDSDRTWFSKNNDKLTPLQLSAKLGVVEAFQFIIKLENVYSFVSAQDGLFDIKLYDITEIDTVANFKTTSGDKDNKPVEVVGRSDKNIQTSQDCISVLKDQLKYPPTESILEMVFASDYQSDPAFRLIETIPVKTIIQEKWKKLRNVYIIWGLIHFILTICVTVEAVNRSDRHVYNSATNTSTLENVASEASVLSRVSFAIGGVLYGFLFLLLIIAKLRRRNALRYIFNNLFYFLFFSILSVSLITDFCMTHSFRYNDNIALIIAVIMGWSFSVFFLRATYLFGFFTEMIRRVLFGDFLRFGIIISFMLIAFTAGIYTAFVGNIESVKDVDAYNEAVSASFSSYGSAMLTMFRLMLGLDDIGVLSLGRLPWLATTLYVIFAILTYVLLMNSLIAMMSQTCSIVCENRYPQWRLQQLSVILFLEDLICLACFRNYLELKCKWKPPREFNSNGDRFFLKIHSLEESYATEEEREVILKTKHEDKHLEKKFYDSFIDTLSYQDSPRRPLNNGISSLPTADINSHPITRSHITEPTPSSSTDRRETIKRATEYIHTPGTFVHEHVLGCPEVRVPYGYAQLDIEPYSQERYILPK